MKPVSATSTIRPSMTELVSITTSGAAPRPAGPRRGAGAADRLGGQDQVVALGDGQARPSRAPGRSRHRTAATCRSRREAGKGRPSRTPIRSPSTRPATASANSAVERPGRAGPPSAAGATVTYGSTAKPKRSEATSQSAMRRAGIGDSANDAGAAHHEEEADEQAEDCAEEPDDAGHGPMSQAPPAGAVSLPPRRRRHPSAAPGSPRRRPRSASRTLGDGDDLQPGDGGGARAGPRHDPIEPEARRLAHAALGAPTARSLPTGDLAEGDGPRAHGPSRSEEASAVATARSAPAPRAQAAGHVHVDVVARSG